jgi:hypothetical protein
MTRFQYRGADGCAEPAEQWQIEGLQVRRGFMGRLYLDVRFAFIQVKNLSLASQPGFLKLCSRWGGGGGGGGVINSLI